MKKEERDKKIKFLEILLTVGSLLGTALTLSKTGGIWPLSLVALPLFIFFSIIYYAEVLYSSRLPSDKVVWGIGYSFAAIFSNVMGIPVIDNLKGVLSIFNNSVSWALALGIGGTVLVIGYFFILSKIIHKILTDERSMESVKEKQNTLETYSKFKLSIGIALLGIGLTMALFGFDKLELHVSKIVLQAYTLFGLIIMFWGGKMILQLRRK